MELKTETVGIVIFEAPDGEHVGHFVIKASPNTVPDSVIQDHAVRHFAQRGHTKVVKAWKARHVNELAEMIEANKKKYPSRPTLDELTGGQPTRALVDESVFNTESE